MDWTTLLSAGPVGGLVGGLLSLGNGWLSIRKIKAEAEIRRDLLKLETDKATIEGANRVFEESQRVAASELRSVEAVAPLATSGWSRGLLVLLCAYRAQLRPTLTVIAHGLALWAFFQVPSAVLQQLALSLFTMAFTYGGWWFGNQTMARLFSK